MRKLASSFLVSGLLAAGLVGLAYTVPIAALQRLPLRGWALESVVVDSLLFTTPPVASPEQVTAPAVLSTDYTGYLAGAPVAITGSGFQPFESVTLQVTHVTKVSCEVGHAPWAVQADDAGGFTASWTIGTDHIAANDFVLTATAPSATLQTVFNRIAVLATDKFDYQPGETATISGAGFTPGESVTVQVTHANDRTGGSGHEPIVVSADENGAFTTPWFVDQDDSLGSILIGSAEGATSRLKAVAIFTDLLVTLLDDNGADDYPGQKDLNQLQTDNFNLPTTLAISWNWDDTAWSGGNTGDACTLFDTDSDGMANYSLCVTVGGSPASYKSTRLYSCGDSRSDRCDQPTTLITSFASTCAAAVTANSDPFASTASHTTGNTCDARTGCYTADTVAACSVKLADFGNPANAFLINVCSYPSQEPNSAPSECVITPNNGFLTLKKVDTTSGDTTAFTFNLGTGQTSQNGTSSWTINGTGQVSLISFAPGTSYDLSEVVPAGWSLDSAVCEIQSGTKQPTGTLSGSTISDFEIKSGLETICTFTDSKLKGTIKIHKSTTGGDDTFDFTGSGASLPATFSITTSSGAGTQTFLSLDDGQYSITESAPPTGWSFDTLTCTDPDSETTTSGATASIDLDPGETVECTFNNSRDTGSLKLSKALSGGPEEYTGPFTIHYDCGAGFTGDKSVAAGSFETIAGIPTGTECTVSEPELPSPPTGYTFGTPAFSPNATVTIDTKDGTVEVTTNNTLTRDSGSLKILKTLSNPDGASVPASFSVNYDCGTGYTGSVSVAPGSPQTVSNIPTGSTCSVTEVAPAPITGYTWGAATYSPASIAIGTKGETFEITVDNSITRDLGALKINKILSNPDGASTPATFSVNYNCGAGYTGSVSVAPGSPQTVSGIPTGNTCSVTEVAPAPITGYSWGTITYTPASVVIATKGETFEITIGNSISRDLGELRISKAFDPLTSGFAGTFYIKYDCDGSEHDGVVSLVAGASQTIAGIPTGTDCTVSEPAMPAAPAGWTFGTPTLNPANGVVTINQKSPAFAEAVVTNSISRDLGELRISKVFDPLTSGFAGTFDIKYDCDGSEHDGVVSLPAGGSQTIAGIPTGTACTVSEPAMPAAPAGWTFGTPMLNPANGVVPISQKSPAFAEAVVTNSISRDLGELRILKTLSNPDGALVPASFSVNYDCGAGYTGSVNVAPGSSQTVPGIPTGNTCSVTEAALAPIPGYTWGTVTYSPPSTVIATKGETFEIAVGNSITRDLGELKIRKAFDAKTSGFAGTFAITYDCEGSEHDGVVSLAAGAAQTISGIPTGTACTVSEPATPTPPTGWTFGTPTLNPANGLVVISEKSPAFAEAVVTNSISRDLGSLRILKTLNNPDGATVPATFSVNYNCGTGYTGSVNVAAGSSQTVSGIPTGNTCSVTETAPAPITGYTWGTVTYSPASTVISTKGATFDITVGNSITRDRGALTITKVVNGAPAGYTGSFGVHVVCTGDGGTYDRTIAYPGSVGITGIPTGNTCTVTESSQAAAPVGYSWGTVSITGSPATISTAITPTVTVTNTVTGRAKVIKTQAGSTSLTQSFAFQLRTGASTIALGTVIEQKIANAVAGNELNFSTVLIPGQHYQMCELVMPGWNTNLPGALFVPGSIIPPALPNPNVDNSPVCSDFVAGAGMTTTFAVDNTYPGGLARTIGFWKNWSSCTTGGQKPVLNQTLALAEPLGLVVAAKSGTFPAFGPAYTLILHATECVKAVNLLNKSTIDKGRKMASDPAFNLAAQLVAAELNFLAGAGRNGTIITAVNDAVLLLGKYSFNGVTHTKISSGDVAAMNNLAIVLDRYNNNIP